ncbi:uncharacterized protein LOC131612220 [Vicia villosa]|uniref:uncharacterized protein LOC131612220 n=1 Tax=Vicia villosa TaxID=3911 RepID=UPI00273B0148|nr:uncharacterized protein LOC131612220 [Vicia villosa]
MDLERGPRYDEYAKLREKKLRFNYQQYQQQDYQEEQQEKENVFESKIPTISTKQAKYQTGVSSVRKGSSSLVAQSVPDFSSLLRKENRKPVSNNMQPTTLTPPLKNKNKGCGVMSSSRGGSRSVNGNGEKRKGYGGGGGILTARKSYANFDELRSFSSATANAINGESRNCRVVGKKTVLR